MTPSFFQLPLSQTIQTFVQRLFTPPAGPLGHCLWIALTVVGYGLLWWAYGPLLEEEPSRGVREVIHWGSIFFLILGYGQGYQVMTAHADPSHSNRKLIWGIAALWTLFIIINLTTHPYHSTDLYGYINRGWQQVHYQTNPYTTVIGKLHSWKDDPMITSHWINNPCPYWPVYAQIAKGLCWLGQGHFEFTQLLFKGLNVLVIGVLGALMYRKNQDMVGLYLFAFNPLLLIHGVANGHNDLLMAAGSVLGALALVSPLGILGLPALAMAGFIKVAALTAIPGIILMLIHQKRWKELILGGAIALLGVFLATFPYISPDIQWSKIGENATVTFHSIPSIFFYLWKEASHILPFLEANSQWMKQVIKTGFSIGYLGFLSMFWILGWRTLRTPKTSCDEMNPLTQYALWILLPQAVLVCFASAKFYPWYALMIFPLGFLFPKDHLARRWLVALSICQLFSITWIGQAHILNALVSLVIPTIWAFQAQIHSWCSRVLQRQPATQVPVSLEATSHGP